MGPPDAKVLTPERQQVERWQLLRWINDLTDVPLVVLSFVWLVLIVLDFTVGLSGWLNVASNVIWGLFVADFVIEFVIAPHKRAYLRRNWLTALSLLLPAVRLLRVFRAFRLLGSAARPVGLLRLLGSLGRGTRALSRTLRRRGFGYVVLLTVLVTALGAAGMAWFESPEALAEAGLAGEQSIANFGEALWWTAMIMTTMGSEYWPQTLEGRILGWLLSLYAFTVFGYITATIASHFIQAKAEEPQAEPLLQEVTALRAQVAELTRQLEALSQRLSGHRDC